MSLTSELREANSELWERMVTHPFVEEMGDGTLPPEKFRRYFLQDYVFVKDLVPMIALGAAKAPTIEDGDPLVKFLAALGPENDLFQRAFAELGASEAEYSAASATPTTQAFGDFIMRTALEGDFIDILTILYVTEGTYLDWATRLLEAGRRPDTPKIYAEWIDIHGPEVLGELVNWLQAFIDNSDIGSRRAEIERIFRTTLRYEYRFWDSAYHGEEWD